MLVAEADVALVLRVEQRLVRGRRGADLRLVVDQHGRVPAPGHQQRLAAGGLQRRDLLEFRVHVLGDVRDAVQVDRLDHAFLRITQRPQAVGFEQVVLRGARQLELGEGLGVAAHADVVDADAGRVEEALDALRLDMAAPGQPVDGAGAPRPDPARRRVRRRSTPAKPRASRKSRRSEWLLMSLSFEVRARSSAAGWQMRVLCETRGHRWPPTTGTPCAVPREGRRCCRRRD